MTDGADGSLPPFPRPTPLLPKLAHALRLSADALLGIAPIKRAAKPGNSRLQRRLQQIDKLGTREKCQIVQLHDTFLEREKLKQRVGAS